MDVNKQRKAEMFMRIEDVENDMEAIEKQLATAKVDLEAARQKVQQADQEVKAMEAGPALPEVSSDESDISSMSEDDFTEELQTDADADAAEASQLEKAKAELEALRAKVKTAASQKEAEDSARRDAVAVSSWLLLPSCV